MEPWLETMLEGEDNHRAKMKEFNYKQMYDKLKIKYDTLKECYDALLESLAKPYK